MFESGRRGTLRVFVHGDASLPAVEVARSVVLAGGYQIVTSTEAADVAIAPLLTKILTKAEYSAPRLGTLIFHPSLLPRHRGRDAIRWTFALREPFTGVTWFWCDEGTDTGPICEQEILPIDLFTRPGEFYAREVLPALARTLTWALADLARGIVRRRPQNEAAATYERPIAKEHPAR